MGSRTRGHKVPLVKVQRTLDVRKYYFFQRTTIEWNNVSTDCVNASRLEVFETQIDDI